MTSSGKGVARDARDSSIDSYRGVAYTTVLNTTARLVFSGHVHVLLYN